MAKVQMLAAICVSVGLAAGSAHAEGTPKEVVKPVATEATTVDELIAMVQAAEAPEPIETEVPAQFQADVPSSAADTTFNPYVSTAFQEDPLPAPPTPPAQTPAPQPEPADDEVTADAEDVGPVFIHEDGTPIGGSVGNFCGAWCRSGFYAGVEGTFLAPISEPDQHVLLTDLTNGVQYAGNTDPGFGAGVRTWIGFQNAGWGIRLRYWHFGNDAIDPRPEVPINAEPTFNESYYLRSDVVDLELTQRFCIIGHQIDTSFGATYVNMQRHATALAYGDVGNGTNLYALAMGANEIEGYGFTSSIGSRFRLWCLHGLRCDDCCGGGCAPRCGKFFAFWNFRGSVLWADSVASALTDANAVVKQDPLIASAFSRNKASASKDHNETVGIVAIQIGLEYQRPLACLPAIAFLRAGFEYQHWETGDVLAESSSFAFLQGSPPEFGGRADARANAHDGDLDLIGFLLGAGLTY